MLTITCDCGKQYQLKQLGEELEAPVPKVSNSLNLDLIGQYNQMRSVLDKYELSDKDVPTMAQITKTMTPENIKKVSNLKEPTLLLVPPVSRYDLVKALDSHKNIGYVGKNIYTYKFKDDDLFGKDCKEWRVMIVEGVQDVKPDPAINDGKKTNYQMAKEWAKKLTDQGLDVLEGADAYLTLMMKGLAEGKPIDPKYWTALNAKNLTQYSLVANGVWVRGQVGLAFVNPAFPNFNLRLRGSVGVDVR